VINTVGNEVRFSVEPLTENCRDALKTGEHCCLGISPFNSYFTEERVRDIASWALATFSSTHFFIPDAAAAYTLEAMGYTPEKAAHKARRQGQYLRNKVRRALLDVGVEDPDEIILDSDTLSGNARYGDVLEQANRLFESDPYFARDCLEASHWVLDKRLDHSPSDEQLRSAVRYLIAELPLFLDSAGIAGTESSVFVYHQSIPFLRRLYEGRLPIRPVPRQGFAVLTSDSAEDPVTA
jgi:cyclo(L-tyrosyl-L-tyrosyl) synthase